MNLRVLQPPVGLESLKGQRKLETYNKRLSVVFFGLDLVACLFEVWSNGEDFVDEILNAKNVVFSKRLLDHLVIGEWHALLADLSVATLVNQLANGFEVGLAENRSTWSTRKVSREDEPIGNIWLDKTEHLLGSPCDLYEDTVVNL